MDIRRKSYFFFDESATYCNIPLTEIGSGAFHTSAICSTEVCKIIQACSNFRGTVAANWLLSATACQSAIFGKIGKKTINLAGIILHLSVVQNLLGSRKGMG